MSVRSSVTIQDKKICIEDVIASEKEKEEGNEFMKTQNYEQAAKSYSKAISLNPQNSILFCNRATAYLKLRSYEQVIQDCDKAIEIKNDYTKAYQRRGKAYLELKEYSKARNDFCKVLESEMDNIDTYNDYKHCSSILVKEKLEEQKKIMENSRSLEEIKDYVFIHEDDYFFDSEEEVRKSLKLIDDFSETGEKFISKGFYNLALNEYEKAFTLITNLSPINPDVLNDKKFRILNKISNCYFKKQEFSKAIENSDLLLRYESITDDVRIEALFCKAESCEFLKLHENALENMRKIIEIDPLNIAAQKEIEKYEFFINKNPLNTFSLEKKELEGFLKNVEKIKEQGNKKFKDNELDLACKEFSNGISSIISKFSIRNLVNNESVLKLLIVLYNNRALVYFKMDLIDLCLCDCFSILKLENNNPKALYRIEKSYEKAEIYDQQAKVLEKLMEIDPNSSVFRQEYQACIKKLEKPKEFQENSKSVPKNSQIIDVHIKKETNNAADSFSESIFKINSEKPTNESIKPSEVLQTTKERSVKISEISETPEKKLKDPSKQLNFPVKQKKIYTSCQSIAEKYNKSHEIPENSLMFSTAAQSLKSDKQSFYNYLRV